MVGNKTELSEPRLCELGIVKVGCVQHRNFQHRCFPAFNCQICACVSRGEKKKHRYRHSKDPGRSVKRAVPAGQESCDGWRNTKLCGSETGAWCATRVRLEATEEEGGSHGATQNNKSWETLRLATKSAKDPNCLQLGEEGEGGCFPTHESAVQLTVSL